MKKHILAIAFALSLTLTITSCGLSNNQSDNVSPPSESQLESSTDAPPDDVFSSSDPAPNSAQEDDTESEENDNWIVVNFPNANSRETYFSIHNIDEAHQSSKGAGIKVGILDWGFGFEEHAELYAGGLDFSSNPDNFNHTNEHGYWMASVLKEIAPECEVYALGTYIPDSEDKWVDAMIEAINWAMENNIDILTLSHQQLSSENRARFDEAVNKAIGHNIVTTFIHYDNPNNILPFGLFADNGSYARKPDVNIFHYDYNTLFVNEYLEYMKSGSKNGNNIPYFSFSSMSPVTAGFVAILKSINGSLSPDEYKDILVKTSYQMYYKGIAPFEDGNVENVVDIGKAVAFLKENY